MTAAIAEGRMEWARSWFDRRIARGAAVIVDGRRARVLSASGGFVFVRLWTSGERIQVRPCAIEFPS